jgi:hypothetical protein
MTVAEFANEFIKEDGCRMWRLHNGKLFLVVDHHRYKNFRKGLHQLIATKVKHKLKLMDGGYYYSAYKKFKPKELIQ